MNICIHHHELNIILHGAFLCNYVVTELQYKLIMELPKSSSKGWVTLVFSLTSSQTKPLERCSIGTRLTCTKTPWQDPAGESVSIQTATSSRETEGTIWNRLWRKPAHHKPQRSGTYKTAYKILFIYIILT